MSGLLNRFRNLSLRWQFVALLLLTQIAAQAVTMTAMTRFGSAFGLVGREALVVESLASLSSTIAIVRALPETVRSEALAAAIAAEPRLSIRDFVPHTDVQQDPYAQNVAQLLLRKLPGEPVGRFAIVTGADEDGRWFAPEFLLSAAYRLDDGRWLQFSQGSGGALRTVPFLIAALTLTMFTVPLAIIAIWSGMTLVAPMSTLAARAAEFSEDFSGSDFPALGPLEVQKLAATLNEMRSRVKRTIDDRAQTLAAISHDMRTPLTRLRLKAESIGDLDLRDSIAGEVDRMDAMIESGLTFLRTQKQDADPVRVDVAVLVRTIADDYADMGEKLAFNGATHAFADCDRELLRRAVENLLSNALEHAGTAVVEVHTVDGHVVIAVSDQGPGIDEAERANVVDPFRKADPSRGGGTISSGFGLGLSITKAIAEQHGGSLNLEANQPQGLIAKIRIPQAPPISNFPDHLSAVTPDELTR
jgi:signal transduction histidine kinase